MKKILSLCMAAVLICGLLLPAAAQPPSLQMHVTEAPVFAGDTLTVTLSLPDALPDVGALEVHLRYDADAVTLQSADTGTANDALQVIRPTADAPYTGVLFAYDYGADGNAEKAFRAGDLLTVVFTVRGGAQPQTLRFSAECVAAQDTVFRPLPLSVTAANAEVVLLPLPTVEIHDYMPERTVAYRTTLTLRADVNDGVEGGAVCWIADGAEVCTGLSCKLENLRADVQVQAQYRLGSRTLAQSQTQTVHVKANFFARLAAFFRALFGKLPVIIQSF